MLVPIHTCMKVLNTFSFITSIKKTTKITPIEIYIFSQLLSKGFIHMQFLIYIKISSALRSLKTLKILLS